MPKLTTLQLLHQIDPAKLDYQEWLNVGMALHYEGYTAADWDEWSSKDGERYNPGECFMKWTTFGDGLNTVTGGTIFQYASNQGWEPSKSTGGALDWDSVISDDGDELVVVNHNWLQGQEIHEPEEWNPVREITRYLETLFDSTEHVSYVTDTYHKDGKHFPKKGSSDRTAGQLLEELGKYKDFESVFGTPNEESGAWIRFNPVDGIDVKDQNVTDYRYALVESDETDLDKQNAIIRELELPVAVLMYSGNKSIHAIVKIDANSYKEYRERVDYLYEVCKKNGLGVDNQNRNPSRLSRMPGVCRKDKKQFIIDTHIGKNDWHEWEEWIEAVNDDLPDPEALTDVWDDLPPLAPPLIHGVLRQGHKMLMAGPSKAGKSFALIGLTIAIAEGNKWMGWQCEKGRVLYVNLELDRPSALHRFKDVYEALEIKPSNLNNIDIWNLRGKSVPMDKLAPKLIRRAAKNNYTAIIIDPIYKVITGDENSADQMAHFTNQFDKIATQLGAAVIFAHHHSKGSQAGKKSMDRASGSGVFARDPDALIDLVELEVTDEILEQEIDREKALLFAKELKRLAPKFYEENVTTFDENSPVNMRNFIGQALDKKDRHRIDVMAQDIDAKVHMKTAWRVEGTLREYPKFDPVHMWFEYPIHRVDQYGGLSELEIDGARDTWNRSMKSARKTKEEYKKEREENINTAYDALAINGEVTVKALEEYMDLSEKTVRNHAKEFNFWVENGVIGRKG